jgi:hypothetical protein
MLSMAIAIVGHAEDWVSVWIARILNAMKT